MPEAAEISAQKYFEPKPNIASTEEHNHGLSPFSFEDSLQVLNRIRQSAIVHDMETIGLSGLEILGHILNNSTAERQHGKAGRHQIEASQPHPPKIEIPANAIKLPWMPDLQQPTDYSCGLTAQCIARAYGVGPDNFDDFMKLLNMSKKEGTDYHNIVKVLNKLGFDTKAQPDMTKEQLKQLLDQKIPVILSLQAWAGNPKDYDDPKNNQNGHYVIAIGYSEAPPRYLPNENSKTNSPAHATTNGDNLVIFFMDPSIISQRGYMTWKELDRRWHENEGTRRKPELSHHMGIIVRPNGLKPVHETVAEPIE